MSIVKCHALLCEIRGELKEKRDCEDIEREVDELIRQLEDVIAKDLDGGQDDLHRIISKVIWWLSSLF
jgi:hypothetical protein